MMTGEVKSAQTEETIVPGSDKLEIQTELMIENIEIQVSVSENSASKFKVKERFSRFKKSLRKRSVSIL